MLIDSAQGKVAFTFTVLQQLRVTAERYDRRGLDWQVPASIVPAMRRMNQMVKRYKGAIRAAKKTRQKPRFQHTIEEAQCEADVALWVANQHRRLNKSPELTSMESFDMPWLKLSL